MGAGRAGRRALLAAALAAGIGSGGAAEPGGVYRGLCDASAAVALDEAHFVVAGDEADLLVTYRLERPEPLARLSLQDTLGGGRREADLEGAARVGERIYWIASHGRNRKGKERPERYRFFATEILPGAPPPGLRPLPGGSYGRLLDDLLAYDAAEELGLAAAARRPPKEQGLNIEGLADDGAGGLLIGFRSPLTEEGAALLVPLLNPAELAEGAGPAARFGPPASLDLGGRGIRSLERVGGSLMIVAGPAGEAAATTDGGPDFALFRWSGQEGDPAVWIEAARFGAQHPEALLALGRPPRLLALSDDGTREVDGAACKDLPAARQSFRSTWIDLP